jgi:hypothetical protein
MSHTDTAATSLQVRVRMSRSARLDRARAAAQQSPCLGGQALAHDRAPARFLSVKPSPPKSEAPPPLCRSNNACNDSRSLLTPALANISCQRF